MDDDGLGNQIMTVGIVVKTTRGNYILSDPTMGVIQGEEDILDLVALCTEPDLHKVLLSEDSLHSDFFDLSTGLAGKISLKLNQYRIKTAVVLDLEKISSDRFKEWASECNRGGEIHFAPDILEAEKWLLED